MGLTIIIDFNEKQNFSEGTKIVKEDDKGKSIKFYIQWKYIFNFYFQKISGKLYYRNSQLVSLLWWFIGKDKKTL